MCIILNKPPRTSSSTLREQLGWTTLHKRRHMFMLAQVHKCLLNQAPAYLADKFRLNSTMYSTTRGASNIHLKQPNTEHFRSTFEFQGALHYNHLPPDLKSKTTIQSFMSALVYPTGGKCDVLGGKWAAKSPKGMLFGTSPMALTITITLTAVNEELMVIIRQQVKCIDNLKEIRQAVSYLYEYWITYLNICF